jgi:hypothetical protein
MLPQVSLSKRLLLSAKINLWHGYGAQGSAATSLQAHDKGVLLLSSQACSSAGRCGPGRTPPGPDDWSGNPELELDTCIDHSDTVTSFHPGPRLTVTGRLCQCQLECTPGPSHGVTGRRLTAHWHWHAGDRAAVMPVSQTARLSLIIIVTESKLMTRTRMPP